MKYLNIFHLKLITWARYFNIKAQVLTAETNKEYILFCKSDLYDSF